MMYRYQFSGQEIEILLQLSRKLGRGRKKTILAASTLLEVCNQLVSSHWAILWAIHHDATAANGFAAHAIQVAPATGPRTIESVERLITQMLSQRGIGLNSTISEQSGGIWMFDELSERSSQTAVRIGGAAIVAEWSIESDGLRSIVSAHRPRGTPSFSARDAAAMKLIRLACEGICPRTGVSLTPRLRQVLVALQRGLTEKECARHLKLSRHTIHEYVKSLHKRFKASSRGELLNLSFDRVLPLKRDS
jgi:DNA-binding CsgD family transcriptional regulator